MSGYLVTGKKRYWWTLSSAEGNPKYESTEPGFLYGYKQPNDRGSKKPSESVSLQGCFVDIPSSVSTLQSVFNIGPIKLEKECKCFVVDTGADSQRDLDAWAGQLRGVIERINAEAWAKTVKTQLQVWPEHIVDKETKEEFDVYTFKITSSGGEWFFKQRFSALAKW